MEHLLLRIALRNTHSLGWRSRQSHPDYPEQLPGFGTGADEALIINLQSRKYHLIENGLNKWCYNYFSDNLLQVNPKISPKNLSKP